MKTASTTGAWRLGVLAGLLLCGLVPLPARAIEGLGVSPTNQELEIAPGAVKSGVIEVINEGTAPLIYQVRVTDYSITNEDYQASFTAPGGLDRTSTVSWFTVPSGNLTVPPGETGKLPYTIRVPKDAAVGGHYATVFAQTLPPTTSGTGVKRIQRVGSIFYINVNGAVHTEGSVNSFAVPWLQFGSPLSATLRLGNEGNVHFASSGEATASDIFGHQRAKTVFRGEVLPGTTRRFALSLPVSAPVGIYKVSVTPHYLDANGPVRTGWVIMVPLLTLVITLMTLTLVLGLWIWLVVRRRKRRRS